MESSRWRKPAAMTVYPPEPVSEYSTGLGYLRVEPLMMSGKDNLVNLFAIRV